MLRSYFLRNVQRLLQPLAAANLQQRQLAVMVQPVCSSSGSDTSSHSLGNAAGSRHDRRARGNCVPSSSRASSTAATAPQDTQASTSSSRGSKEQDAQQDPKRQRQRQRQRQRPVIFSIRPSALSPLYPIYRDEHDLSFRGDYLRTVAAAHKELSQQLTAHTDADVAAELAGRRAGMEAVVDAYEPLAKADKLLQVSDPKLAQGYYWLLEQKAQMKDDEFLQFSKVLAGDVSVWDYWFSNFSAPYRDLPSLDPMEAIFSKDDPLEEARRLRRQALRHLAQPSTGPRQPKVDDAGRARAVGRRKTSSAKVFVWSGDGRVLVNMRSLDEYFSDVHVRHHALKPMMVAGATGRVNVLVQVSGGGISGQAQAVGHGIARALQNLDPASYRKPLEQSGLLKRDPRMVERKKPGKAKARRSFAWVKR